MKTGGIVTEQNSRNKPINSYYNFNNWLFQTKRNQFIQTNLK